VLLTYLNYLIPQIELRAKKSFYENKHAWLCKRNQWDGKNNSAYEEHFVIFLSLNYFNFNLNVIKGGAST